MGSILEETKKKLDAAQDRVFTLATAILAISITFRGVLVGEPPQGLWLLGVSWAAFAIAVVSYFASFVVESRILVDVGFDVRAPLSRAQQVMIGLPMGIQWASFAAGVMFLTVFALLN